MKEGAGAWWPSISRIVVSLWERLPELSFWKGDAFSLAREKMTDPSVFSADLLILEEVLVTYNLKNRLSHIIYNCDESGMPFEHKPSCVILAKGAKKVRHCFREQDPDYDPRLL